MSSVGSVDVKFRYATYYQAAEQRSPVSAMMGTLLSSRRTAPSCL